MKKKLNVRLLRRIQRHILGEPKRFDMGDWGRANEGETPCNTTACIGGWAVILASRNPKRYYRAAELDVEKPRHGTIGRLAELLGSHLWSGNNSVTDRAMRALGINHEQAGRLFHDENWPDRFQSPLGDSLRKRARRAVRRIDHFIKTKGEE